MNVLALESVPLSLEELSLTCICYGHTYYGPNYSQQDSMHSAITFQSLENVYMSIKRSLYILVV